MKTIVLLIVFSLGFFVTTVFAGDPPTLLAPQKDSIVTTSKLTWQTPAYSLYSSNPYNIELDNNMDFSSPEKDYTTANTSYTPQLEGGTWYWRVRVKDLNGVWSSWSTVWTFTLTQATPTPTISSSISPTPSNIPTASSASKFNVSSVPSQINSFDSFNADIILEVPNNPNSTFYIKGAFQMEDSSNYFGQTLVDGNWIKNNKSYDSQYKITTDSSGKWSGSIQIKSDVDDSGFKGSSEYIFKVGRYSQSGSGLTWSNETKIKINGNTDSSSPSPTSFQTPSPTKKSDSSEYRLLSTSKPSTKIVFSATNSSSVAGIATGSTKEEVLVASESKINWWFIGGGIILLITGVVFVVKFIRQKKENALYN